MEVVLCFDASSESVGPAGDDKGFSRLAGMYIAFEGGYQVEVGHRRGRDPPDGLGTENPSLKPTGGQDGDPSVMIPIWLSAQIR